MDFFDDVKSGKKIFIIISLVGNIILFIATGISLYLYFSYECICETPSCAILKNEEVEKEEKEEINPDFYVEIKGAVTNPGVYKVNNTNIINDVVLLAGGLNKDAYTDNINLSKKVSKELVIYIYTKDDFKNINVPTTDSNKVENECICPSYDISSCTEEKKSEIVSSEKEDMEEDSNKSETSDTENKENIQDNEEVSDSKDDEQDSSMQEKPDITPVSPNVNKKININLATKKELTSLNGIGDSKAEKIIAYRNQNGIFKNIEDIKKVSGIGDAIYAKIKDYITV